MTKPTTALVRRERQEVEVLGGAINLGPRNYGELEGFAAMVHESGMFKDIQSASAAAVKIVAGAEFGLSPISSLRSLHVFEGKVEMSAHLMLSLCKQAGYRIKVLQADDQVAMLEWYDPQGELCGPAVGFTMREATNAGLTRKFNWKAYAADMLWARAISRGARRYCPEVTHGVYVDGEISQAPSVDNSAPRRHAAPDRCPDCNVIISGGDCDCPPARSHQSQPTPQPTIEPISPPADPDAHPGAGWQAANKATRGVLHRAGITEDERKLLLSHFWHRESFTELRAKHLNKLASAIEDGPTEEDRSYERQSREMIEAAGGELGIDEAAQMRDLAKTPWQVVLLDRLFAGGEG